MSTELLPCVETETGADPRACVIWLHGLGDSGHGFAPIVPHLNLPQSLPVRFVFPHAPERPVTINNGQRMRAWYDIKGFDMESRADIEGVVSSSVLVEALIDAQIKRGIPADKIVLAGFSQGGVIALHLGSRISHKLAGIMGLSTYLAAPGKMVDEAVDVNKTTPLLLAHGTQDDVVPLSLGEMAKNTLTEAGFMPQWNAFTMQHNVCMEEIELIGQWLQKVLR